MELSIIQSKIYTIRGQKVMLDRDLAELYGVTTGNLNLSVKRNHKRFPEDFMFQLTSEEWNSLRLQFATLKNGRGQQPKYLPFVFTELGVAMLSSVLNSEDSIKMSKHIMRTFIFSGTQFGTDPIYINLSDKSKCKHVISTEH